MARSNRTDMSQLARAWAIAFDVVANLLAGGLLGFGLDWVMVRLFGWKSFPILMLVFAGLGLANGFLRFFRDAMQLNRELTRDWKRDHPPEEGAP